MTDDRIREIAEQIAEGFRAHPIPHKCEPRDFAIAVLRAACDEAAREERERAVKIARSEGWEGKGVSHTQYREGARDIADQIADEIEARK